MGPALCLFCALNPNISPGNLTLPRPPRAQIKPKPTDRPPLFSFFSVAGRPLDPPKRVICATTPLELVLLTGSRMSAGVLYASLTISILTKCYATRSYLHHSWLGAVVDLEPSHDMHTCRSIISYVSAELLANHYKAYCIVCTVERIRRRRWGRRTM